MASIQSEVLLKMTDNYLLRDLIKKEIHKIEKRIPTYQVRSGVYYAAVNEKLLARYKSLLKGIKP